MTTPFAPDVITPAGAEWWFVDRGARCVVRGMTASREEVLAQAVIDASGTIETPGPLGASGLPALGESALADRIFYGIPDVLGTSRQRHAGRRVLVVGSGHSALNGLLDLAHLAEVEPDTRIVWAIRRPALGQLLGGARNDQLEERGKPAARVRTLLDEKRLHLLTGFRIDRLMSADDGIVAGGGERLAPPVDEVIAATGFRPDWSILSEVRVDLDPAVQSPRALASLIAPNVHSCGTVRPHDAEELKQPERNLFVVGMKSYGRAPTFLMLTGYEQARSVVAAIAGDWEAARPGGARAGDWRLLTGPKRQRHQRQLLWRRSGASCRKRDATRKGIRSRPTDDTEKRLLLVRSGCDDQARTHRPRPRPVCELGRAC